METFKKRRRIILESMKNLENFASSVDDDTPIEDMRTPVSNASSLYTKFVESEDKIMAKDPSEESEVIQFEEIYYKVVSKLNARIRVNLHMTSTLDETHANQSIAQGNMDLKLPRTNIPPFDGNYKDWQSFFDLFTKSVHDNCTLSAAQKFQLLKRCLKGEAYNLLKHFAITEAN